MKKANCLFGKTLLMLFVVAFVCLALSTMALAQDAEGRYGGVIKTPIEDVSLPSMDPHQAINVGTQSIGFMVADPLIIFAEGEYIPVLAEDWESSEDASSYTLYIREGVKFHNGETLVASDVKKNFERISDESLVDAGHIAGIDSMEVLDDYTLKINLKTPEPYFISGLQEIAILEPNSWEDLGEDDAVLGTGPFMYDADSYEPESGMTLIRFDDYWQGQPYLEAIDVVITGSRAASRIQLERGDLHVAGFVDFGVANTLEEEGKKIYPFGRVNWARIVFNFQEVDLPLRKAINYAFAPEVILDSPAIFAGFGIIQDSIAYPDTPLYKENVGYEYNPDRAEEILDEAGYVDSTGDGIREKEGENIVLSFPTREGMGWSQATETIQDMLLQIGIDSEIEVQPTATFYGNVREGNYDIAWWLTNSAPEPPIGTVTFDARQYWQVTQVDIEEMQNLLEEAEREADEARRAELYKELQQLHHENAVEALGIWMEQVHAVRPEVQNFKTTTLGHFYNFHNWSLEE